jgi:hypothetical protein
MLEGIDALNTGEALLAPYEEQLQQAESMPCWGRRSAEDASPKPASI